MKIARKLVQNDPSVTDASRSSTRIAFQNVFMLWGHYSICLFEYSHVPTPALPYWSQSHFTKFFFCGKFYRVARAVPPGGLRKISGTFVFEKITSTPPRRQHFPSKFLLSGKKFWGGPWNGRGPKFWNTPNRLARPCEWQWLRYPMD